MDELFRKKVGWKMNFLGTSKKWFADSLIEDKSIKWETNHKDLTKE